MANIYVRNTDWRTKNIPIKNRTVRVMKNGVTIPTELAMFRKAAKI